MDPDVSTGKQEGAPSKKNHHLRNIEHLKALKEKNSEKLMQLEQEKSKLEHTRQRLAKLVLKRAELARKQAEERKFQEENKDPEPIVEEKKELDAEQIKQKQLKAFYRSRYHTLLATIQANNKQKEESKMKEDAKRMKKEDKLKQVLGLDSVQSKLLQPTVASMGGKGEEEPELKARQFRSNSAVHKRIIPKPPEMDEESKQKAREAAELIKKRASDHIATLEKRKAEEIRKEEIAKEKEAKLRQTLREAVLLKAKTVEKKEPERPASASPKKPKKKLDEKHIEKLAAAPKRFDGPIVTDMMIYKKKKKLSEDDKVFIVNGGFPDLIRAMKKRGWHENMEKNSPCFDFIWTLSYKDVDFPRLQEHQLCNHFEKSSAITTKIGLINSLRNLIWFNNVDIDTFYPRAFDLNDPDERQDFITEFKAVQAESTLKKLLKGEDIPLRQIKAAIKVCERRGTDLGDLIDDRDIANWCLVKDSEWEILSENILSEEQLKMRKHNTFMQNLDPKHIAAQVKSPEEIDEGAPDEETIEKARELLDSLGSKQPQMEIDGSSNIWIVKPAGLSRGRGIAVYASMAEIMDHVSKEGVWIVQKYIENPLLIQNKKFDIRQWVLVTCWNPLTIWFYERCYCRFGVEDFSFSNINDLYAHLTNNSIVKNSDNFYHTDIEGSMWHSEELAEFLHEREGFNIWEDTIKDKIKQIVKWSLESAQDMVNNRKNSFELYGYDFMLDDKCNPWLIEINKSPAMDYSTPVTKKLVKLVMEDCAKVVVDYNFAPEKKKSTVDTGNFSLIYKAKRAVDRPIQSMGISLMCEGKAIKK